MVKDIHVLDCSDQEGDVWGWLNKLILFCLQSAQPQALCKELGGALWMHLWS